MDDECGILKFISGIDLSKYKCEDFISARFEKFENLKWLKISQQNREKLPDLSKLESLTYITASKNRINDFDDLLNLKNLSVLNLRRNIICKSSCHIKETFSTMILDISHNNLDETPSFLNCMPNLVLLNLSYNNVKNINIIKSFEQLLFLDVSHNRIAEIDKELFSYITNLNYFNLSYNPIDAEILKNLVEMPRLLSLNLSGLNLSQIELDFGLFHHLQDLDISKNGFTQIPESVFYLKDLTRLNVSENSIDFIGNKIVNLKKLNILNISFNKIRAIPPQICELSDLRRIYANGNLIATNGIPEDISNLKKLETLMLSFNHLQMLPVCVCKCSTLKRLSLRNNKLLTLPYSIYDLNLISLDVKGNPDFTMPKKNREKTDPMENMNFSYENVRNMVLTLVQQQLPPSDAVKENKSKEKIIVHRKTNIQKLDDIQNIEKHKVTRIRSISSQFEEVGEIKPEIKIKKLDLTHTQMLDCNEIFPENTSCLEGVSIFVLENFHPVLQEDNTGIFYEGDCYIVLNHIKTDCASKYQIFYWIGKDASIDKVACAAIHSVNLRNLLMSEESTKREDQNDESDEFRSLFPFGFVVNTGMSVPSSLVDGNEHFAYSKKMYRIWIHPQKNTVVLSRVSIALSSFDQRFVFLLIDEKILYLWFGKKSKPTLRNKARLCADKLNRSDRKNMCKIVIINDDDADFKQFCNIIGIEDQLNRIGDNKLYDEIHIQNPIIYRIELESGAIELPQVPLINDRLKKEMLLSQNVYIVDCWDDIFVWHGKRSQRMIKEAARRISIQLQRFFTRSTLEPVQLVQEGMENFIFKSHFFGWDDIVKEETKKPVKPQPLKTEAHKKLLTHEDFSLPKMEIASIFLSKQQPLTDDHCESLLEAVEEYLERMDCFVFENKVFIPLPDNERGHFYSSECYVFLLKTVVPVKVDYSRSKPTDDEEGEECKMEVKYRVFFWEGRDCQRTGYLTFAFSLKRKFEELFGDKLSLERIHQQQEPLEFLALFHPIFIIHRGFRPIHIKENNPLYKSNKFYQIRDTMGMLTLRCIEIELDSQLLCSRLFYILISHKEDHKDIYLWIGSKVDEKYTNSAKLILTSFHMSESDNIFEILENEEPEDFWMALGQKKPYDHNGIFIDLVRLFRCTNEFGYYAIKEKYSDYCQDDLMIDDVMMFDDGNKIFLWEGPKASDIEVSMTRKLAPIYAQNCKMFNIGNEREIIIVKSGEEPIDLKRAFQGFDSRPKIDIGDN